MTRYGAFTTSFGKPCTLPDPVGLSIETIAYPAL